MIHVYSAISISLAVEYISLISFLCTLNFKFEIERNINAVTRNKRSALLYLRILIMFFMSFELIDHTTFTTLLRLDVDKSVTLMFIGHVFILSRKKVSPLFHSLNKL